MLADDLHVAWQDIALGVFVGMCAFAAVLAVVLLFFGSQSDFFVDRFWRRRRGD